MDGQMSNNRYFILNLQTPHTSVNAPLCLYSYARS